MPVNSVAAAMVVASAIPGSYYLDVLCLESPRVVYEPEIQMQVAVTPVAAPTVVNSKVAQMKPRNSSQAAVRLVARAPRRHVELDLDKYQE